MDAILELIFDEFAEQPTAIREAVTNKFHSIGFAETPVELSEVITQFKPAWRQRVCPSSSLRGRRGRTASVGLASR